MTLQWDGKAYEVIPVDWRVTAVFFGLPCLGLLGLLLLAFGRTGW